MGVSIKWPEIPPEMVFYIESHRSVDSLDLLHNNSYLKKARVSQLNKIPSLSG